MQCLPSGEEQDEADDAASVADPAKRLVNPADCEADLLAAGGLTCNRNDDIFMDNVDDQVVDQGVAKGKKVSKGKRAQVVVGRGDEDFSTDDEELMVLNSDAENNVTFNFKSFKHEDLVNPVFKVGIIFESAELLRKAITEYSMKHRVDIKMPRNEKKRLRAICEKGCPWNLYASDDRRVHGMMIKTFCGEYNCHKKCVLKRCTSNWLADKYLESFRADKKTTLENFARIVQKEWNLTPARTKLARARRIAMKRVMGDEAEQYKLLWDYAQELRRTNPANHKTTATYNCNKAGEVNNI
ncbi:uncharacterized protein [Miscanthus floridulus]|uniref:uncharacterized protein n=1 Tax=Miscanthus floridulus TaxID=154761 RepID=UPI0034599A8A